VIQGALSIDSWAATAMIGLSAIPLTVMGGQASILQGEERWVPLAAIFVGMGLGRIVLGAILMPLMPNEFGAMLSVALGAAVPAVIGFVALGRSGATLGGGAIGRGANRILHEVVSNSSALLAFFALCNLDVIIARIRFDEHDAGLYAGGLILTKAVLFLPQFVVVIAFPSMASSSSATHRMYLRGLAAVATIGLAATLGAAVLKDLAVTFVGGEAYREVEPNIWLFATLGTLLALVQLMVYEVVARQHRASVLIIWLGLAAVGCVAPFVDTGAELVRAVALVDLGVLLTLVLTATFHPALRTPAADSSA
jgi:O-antigen/teichoic acid export membrane protein